MDKKLKVNTRYFQLFPSEKYNGYAYEEFEANLSESAFLVVDVYGLGHHPDDPLPTWKVESHDQRDRPALAWKGSAEHEAYIVRDSLLPALNAARDLGMTVIYLNNSAPKIGLAESEFGKLLRRQLNTDMERMFAEDIVDPKEYHYGDSDHVKISKLLEPREGEYFVRKHVYSGFVGTRLDLLLRYLKIHNLFVVGFSADACLFTTIVDALWHDYKCILLRDCTLANDFEEEQAELLGTKRMIKLMEALYCVSITSSEFIEAAKKVG
ncbi:MAG: isochorismatase family protein [Anaerolineae bacterium]|jgi:ureidoacrylate peracid hydrolase|nr:isochorismatase family protein [Anaerolineae bacterium]